MKQRFVQNIWLVFIFVLFGVSCSGGTIRGVYKTENQGENWDPKVFVGYQKRKAITISNIDVEALVVDPQDPNRIFLASKNNGVFLSETAGEQWRKLPVADTRIRDISIDPRNSATVFSVIDNQILKSIDGGESWSATYTDAQGAIITQVEVDPFRGGRIFATTSIGSILVSEDDAANWRVVLQVEEPITKFFSDPQKPEVAYAMELDHNIHKTIDGGGTWIPIFTKDLYKQISEEGGVRTTQIHFRQLTVDPNNSEILYTSSREGLLRSADGGITWHFIKTLIEFNSATNENIRGLIVLPGDSNTLMFAVGNVLHKSADFGMTWRTIEGFPAAIRITAITPNPKNGQVLFLGVEQVEDDSRGPFRRIRR